MEEKNIFEVNYPVDSSSFSENLLYESYTEIKEALLAKRMKCSGEEVKDCLDMFYCYRLCKCIECGDYEDGEIHEPDVWITGYCDKEGNLIMPFMLNDSEELKNAESEFLEKRFFYVNGYKFQKIEDGAELLRFNGDDENVVIPDKIYDLPVKSLCRTFYHNEKIRQVIIPDGEIELGAFTFCGCSNLERVEISKNTQINRNAFEYCDALVQIRKNKRIIE